MDALVDTGSEVSTVTESWLRSHFPDLQQTDLNWLQLKGAYGLEIPYNGIIEITMGISTQTISNVLVLVVKDSIDEETRQRNALTPAVLGMNVLGKMENFF